MCKELGLTQVEIECDSKIVVEWVRAKHCTLWYLQNFWEKFIAVANGISFSISHQFREGNMVADFLARNGETGCSRRYEVLELLPKELKGILRLEKLDLPYIRV